MSNIHISRERLEEAIGVGTRDIESFPVARRPYLLWLVRVVTIALLVVFWGGQIVDVLDGGPYFGALQGSVGVLISGSLVGQALAFGAFGRSEKFRAAGRSILLSVTIVFFATLPFILALLGAQLSGNVAGWGLVPSMLGGGAVGMAISAVYTLFIMRRYRRRTG